MAGAFDTDLLVVGCGPVGVTTALLAARRGLRVLAVDRATDVYALPRAVVMDEEIQQVLRDAGVEVDDITTPLVGAEFVRADGTRVTGIEIPPGFVLPSGLPPAVAYEQPQLEARLRDHATAAGVTVDLGTEVTDLADDADGGVVAELAPVGGGAERQVRARWLVGCDGARSSVRKRRGIAFVDQGFDQRWLVVDTWLRRDVELSPFVQQICAPERSVTFVPGHDRRRRFEFLLHDDEPDELMTEPARVAELLAPWLAPADAEITRAVVYRFHALVAERFRDGPVFLAGDAAHQMPPFNGQGLCSGVRDAANLVWKLDLVRRGLAPDTLLDTYDAERRPHAEAQVVHSADAGKLIEAIAGRIDHGDVADLLDAGYGAGRPFPKLTTGMLVPGPDAVGRPFPLPILADGRRTCDLLGDGFALVAADDPRPGVDDEDAARWDAVGARWVAIGHEPWLAGLLGGGLVAVVRPDRYLAALVSPSELPGVTDLVLGPAPVTS